MKSILCAAFLGGVLMSTSAMAQKAGLNQSSVPIDRAGYMIERPGRYCVVKDLHTRLDFADHSAERALIEIHSSDVDLDLRGHRLGRGWLFTQPGGSGIIIGSRVYYEGTRFFEDARMENIVIRNGRITDMNTGIFFYRRRRGAIAPVLPRPLLEIAPKIYKYETTDILIKDITFERCEVNVSFNDWISSREMYIREKSATQANFN